MKKYVICEGTPDGEYNAQSKARNDAEEIIVNNGYKRLYIPTKYGVEIKKIKKYKQLICYINNYFLWKEYINKLDSGDIIIFQYPILNTMVNFEKIMKLCERKNITTICLIHDMDSIRFSDMPRKIREDKKVLNGAKYIIAHNDKMKKKLIELGNSEEKIIELGIFDYFVKCEISEKNREKKQPIIIAGNLSKQKAKYICSLKDIKDIKFNLYGKGYQRENGEENISYKGAFLPEELPNNLEGSFGLVWDGESSNTCSGNFGEYMRYNNPHKVSLYVASEIPVVIWKEAALASFVLENNIGIAIESINEIYREISKLTDENYNNMKANIKNIAQKVRDGYFLTRALKQVEEIIKKDKDEKINN